MTSVRWLFRGAALYGVVALLPMYFDVPPGLARPEFYFGFVGVALAWQFAFLVIAHDPQRYRLLILPGMVEKLGFGIPALVLFAQDRAPALMALAGAIDLAFAAAFVWAFVHLGRTAPPDR